MKINAAWIAWAINTVKSGKVQKLEQNGVIVYSCGKIIRIDVKLETEVAE